jgi:hypothetical protein
MEMALMEAGEGVLMMTSLSARILPCPRGVSIRAVTDLHVPWVVARARPTGPEPLKDAIIETLVEEIRALLAKPWRVPFPCAAGAESTLNPAARDHQRTVEV